MRALICGVNGQDGSYLAKLLVDKGYEVVGTSRDALATPPGNLKTLGIARQVRVVSMALNDFRSVLKVVQGHSPDEIYNLAGQTSVGLSFEQPVEAIESIAGAAINLLEVIRFLGKPVRFYNAGSSECFGDTGELAADEQTPFQPRSPYAVAKASAHWLVKNYRESYGLFACTGILFNHESTLRPERFVTQKVVRAAARIHGGSKEKLQLGNTGIQRDWGWSPDYVDAMWRMIQQDTADDFVIATGQTASLEDFVAKAFAFFGRDWREHVAIQTSLLRPSDIHTSRANAGKARKILQWSASHQLDDVVRLMCEAAKSRQQGAL